MVLLSFDTKRFSHRIYFMYIFKQNVYTTFSSVKDPVVLQITIEYTKFSLNHNIKIRISHYLKHN